MKRIYFFFASMTGRIFMILAVGMVAAALIGTAITGVTSNRQFAEQLLARTADRVEQYVAVVDAVPAARDVAQYIFSSGVRPLGFEIQTESLSTDPDFQAVLAARGGVLAKAGVSFAEPKVCLPELYGVSPDYLQQFWQNPDVQKALTPILEKWNHRPRPTTTVVTPPTCRVISLVLSDGTPFHLSVDTPWIERERSRLFDPLLLTMLVVAVAVLAYFVARIASAPLHRLSSAATELGQDIDRAPAPVAGPTEVRRAAAAFNSMQRRLQKHISERTQMLASITHDLQTPLTRLRLRLERIGDEALRDRLVADLSAMSELIEEGLELARSAETSEPLVMLELDSLLESLVEDAVDAGATAMFEHGCNTVMRLRPLVARRLFSNLIDNAIKYGGCALVSAVRLGPEVSVRIRDRGPGLPPEMMERVFDPFIRLEASRSRESGGAGLGLTIARKLAEASGATLMLHNNPEGGLEAVVRWADGTGIDGTASRRET
jgi:signal transduction histidine kinase